MQVTDKELERLCDVFQEAALTVSVNRGMDPHQRTRPALRAVLAELEMPPRIAALEAEMDSNGMYTIQKSVVRRLLGLSRKVEVEEP